jgi:hypothetical protein
MTGRNGSATGASHRAAESIAFVLATLVYALILMWSYAHVESQVFGYAGAAYQPPGLGWSIATYAIAALPAALLSPRAERASSSALAVMYVLVYVPFVVIAPHIMEWPIYEVILFDLFLLFNLLVVRWLVSLPNRRFAAVPIDERTFNIGVAGLTATLAFLPALMSGFHVDLSIGDVYTRRLAARESVPAGSPAAYAISILRTTLLPLSLSIGIVRRRLFLVSASLLAVVTIFSLNGQKSVALTPLLLLGSYALLRYAPRFFGPMAALGAAALVVMGDLMWFVLGNSLPSGLLTFRLLVAPVVNMGRYLRFFSDHPVYLLTGSILRGVLPSPYDRPMTMMLGAQYDPDEQLNLNCNVWATAFGDGGYPAIVIASILIGILLWLMDSWMRETDRPIFVLVGVFVGFILCSSALPTAVLSGGLAPTLMALFLLGGTTRRSFSAGV